MGAQLTGAQIGIKVSTDTKDAEKGLDNVGEKASKAHGLLHGFFGQVIGTAAGIGVVAGVAGAFGFLAGQVQSVFDRGSAAQKVMAQTNAVLASTHGAAGETAQSVKALAEHLSDVDHVDDQVAQSAENMLLTFTNIGKKGGIFDQATQTALDMSQALGQDVKSSAIQLGKALNDPIHGITALQRVGVTFDEQQKKLINTYMQHGQTAKAQAVILQELQKEFGGSAKAAGDTFGGKMAYLGIKLDQVKEKIFTGLMPVLNKLADAVGPVLSDLADALPGMLDGLGKMISGVVGPAFAALGPLLQKAEYWFFTFIGGVTQGVGPLAGLHGMLGMVQGALSRMQAIIARDVLPILASFGAWFIKDGVPALRSLADFVLKNAVPAIERLAGFIRSTVAPILTTLFHILATEVVPAVKQVASAVLNTMLPPLERIASRVLPLLLPAFRLMGWILQNVVGPAVSAAASLIGGLLNVIDGVLDKLGGFLGKIGQAKDAVGGFLSHIPGFAEGGVTLGGPFVAAENGPELLLKPGVYNAPAGSVILPAAQTRQLLSGVAGMAGGGSGGAVNHWHISIQGATAEEVLAKLRAEVRRKGL